MAYGNPWPMSAADELAEVGTPLHPRAERQARLSKYTCVGRFTEARLREMRQCVRLGMMSVAEMRAQMYGC